MRLAALTALLLLGLTLPASAGDATVDIKALEQRQQDAWNAHDAHAYAVLFTEDSDVVNVLGWWWKGRAELETKLTGAFASVFQGSTLTVTDTDVRMLTPDIAIAHVRWTMAGAKTPDGVASHVPQLGIQTQVLRKQDGAWLISAFQNTNDVTEKPFPGAPSPH